MAKRPTGRSAAQRAADAKKEEIIRARSESGRLNTPASKKAKKKAQKKRSRRWNRKASASEVGEDRLIERYGGRVRIKDMGQTPPKGYVRGGGRYFVRAKYLRPIKSRTTPEAAAWYASHRANLYGADGEGTSGWVNSAGRQGQYSSAESLINFRRTTAARKSLDLAFPDKEVKRRPGHTKGESAYILDFGQDGHMR